MLTSTLLKNIFLISICVTGIFFLNISPYIFLLQDHQRISKNLHISIIIQVLFNVAIFSQVHQLTVISLVNVALNWIFSGITNFQQPNILAAMILSLYHDPKSLLWNIYLTNCKMRSLAKYHDMWSDRNNEIHITWRQANSHRYFLSKKNLISNSVQPVKKWTWTSLC